MVKFMVLPAKYNKEVKLSSSVIDKCKGKKIAIYTAVQFLEQIEDVVIQLQQNNVKVVSSQPARTESEFQILGCDCNWDNLKLEGEVDAFLYVGDGMFHPTALVLAQREQDSFKEVIVYDPTSGNDKVLGLKDMDKVLKKYKGSYVKFLSSDVIGVLVSTKPGQKQYEVSKKLSSKYPDKKFYYFISNDINFSEFENFNFIQCWVNTACPRIGFEDSSEIKRSIVNLSDVLRE